MTGDEQFNERALHAKRVLALDIGEVRIGIAASDLAGKLAFPVEVLPADEVMAGARSFRRIIEDHDPEILLVGLPLTLSGEEGPQVKRIRGMADTVAHVTGLPVYLTDERLSSREAKRLLREQGVSEKQARGKVDKIAASLVLQAWLDARTRNERGGDGR